MKQRVLMSSIAWAISAIKSMSVIFDRQYSPFIFAFQGQKIIPAESVYGVFESKADFKMPISFVTHARSPQVCGTSTEQASQYRNAGGTYEPKTPMPILGGILTFESDWSPPLGEPLQRRSRTEMLFLVWILDVLPRTECFIAPMINLSSPLKKSRRPRFFWS